MDDVRKLFNEDVRQKSIIARSSKGHRTQFPIAEKEGRYCSMTYTDPMEITTAEQVFALIPEKRLEWLKTVQQNPGFTEMGKRLGVKYHWFADRLRSTRKQLGILTENPEKKQRTKEGDFGSSLDERMRAIAEETIKKAESRIEAKLTEYITQSKEELNKAMMPVNSVIKALEGALEEVREVKGMFNDLSKSVKAQFDCGYFVNRELDAESLAKRLNKLADTVSITDSRYHATISLIEID